MRICCRAPTEIIFSGDQRVKIPYRVVGKSLAYSLAPSVAVAKSRATSQYVAKSLERFLGNGGSRVCISWPTNLTPPTLGDIVPAMVLARALDLSGVQVSFIVSTFGGFRWDWANPLLQSPEDRLIEWISLFDLIVPKLAGSNIWRDKKGGTAELHPSGCFRIQSSVFLKVSELVAGILHYLSKRGTIINQSSLFLDSLALDNGLQSTAVAWHVRHSPVGEARNPMEAEIVADYLRLKKLNRPIVLFSDRPGREFVEKVLHRSFGNSSPWGKTITPQQSSTFSGAISEVLGSSGYFHRVGGGMAIAPIFSGMPYYIQDKNAGLYRHFRPRELVHKFQPWSLPQQYYRNSPSREIDEAGFRHFFSALSKPS